MYTVNWGAMMALMLAATIAAYSELAGVVDAVALGEFVADVKAAAEVIAAV